MFKLRLKDGTEFNVPNSRLYDSQLQIIDNSKTNLVSYEEKMTVDNLSNYSLYDGEGNLITTFVDKKYILNSLHFSTIDGMQVGVYDLQAVDKTEKELNNVKNKLLETQEKLSDITNRYNLLNDTVAEFILKSSVDITTGAIVEESVGE